MTPHLNDRDIHPPHPPSRKGLEATFFFPRKNTDTPSMKGKSTFSAPIMKEKSTNLPREGKRAGKTSISINFSREKLGD